MSLRKYISGIYPYEIAKSLYPLLGTAQGPQPEVDTSILYEIPEDQHDGLIFNLKPRPIDGEALDVTIADARIALADGYWPLVGLISAIETAAKQAYGADEGAMVTKGAILALATLREHAEAQELNEQIFGDPPSSP